MLKNIVDQPGRTSRSIEGKTTYIENGLLEDGPFGKFMVVVGNVFITLLVIVLVSVLLYAYYI